MFFSKIWLFLLTLVAALAVIVALLLPRPAERAHVEGERQRLSVGCGVVNILLGDNARQRVDFARRFGRAEEVVAVVKQSAATESVDERRNASAREIIGRLVASAKGDAPDFVMLVDTRGRVVARVGRDDKDFGDVAAGRPLVDDALAGLVRDDVWATENTLLLVAAAPVISREPLEYVGAVVLGHRITADMARALTEWSRGDKKNTAYHVDMAVYLGTDQLASTSPVALDPAPMAQVVGELTDPNTSQDCLLNRPINLQAGKSEYTAVVARLPGEAARRAAYFTVFIQRPGALGLVGTTKAVRKSDLALDQFPWIFVGAGFLVALILGLGLMVLEADRPLRRLVNDAGRLARGDTDRLSEEHPGRFGSVARNVNIQIDRVARAAKTAKQDLDQLLGPAPQGSLGTIDLLAGVAPASGPAIATAAPPPSEFRFSDTKARDMGPSAPGMPPYTPPTAAAARPKPPVPRAPTPPPMPVQPAPPLRLDDDILGTVPAPAAPSASVPVMATRTAPASAPPPAGFDGSTESYFRDVYSQFIAAKQACGEPTAGVTFEKFTDKLRRNREELMSRTSCRDVSFTVYVKDGKAALKASPVR